MDRAALLFFNPKKQNALSFCKAVAAFLKRKEIACHPMELDSYEKADVQNRRFSFIITLGGDGTLLKAVHEFHSLNVPFFAINNGTLGFITPYSKSDWKIGLESVAKGSFKCSKRIMLKVRHMRKKQVVKEDVCVNEAYLHRPPSRSVIRIRASVNKEVFAAPLCADGVIIATPTGSTAYSMAAGASILSNDMEAFVFMPNNPFMSMDRGLVFTNKAKLKLEMMGKDVPNGIIECDGVPFSELGLGESVEISVYESKVSIIRNPSLSEFERIGSKLEWLKR